MKIMTGNIDDTVNDHMIKEEYTMKVKMAKFREKAKKIILNVLLVLFMAFVTYMVYVHRRVIRALIKGEPIPRSESCPAAKHHLCCCCKKA